MVTRQRALALLGLAAVLQGRTAGGADALFDPTNTQIEGSRFLEASRVTLAYESAYKTEAPEDVVKSRLLGGFEYSEHFLDHYFAQVDVRSSAFLHNDHRRGVERTDTRITEAYLQASFGRVAVTAGIQTLPWGESILAPITDEISPRDNRELFNFNLDELRLGQPMFSVDRFTDRGRLSAFVVPEPEFDRNPERGSAYFFTPFGFAERLEGDARGEYGVSYRRSFESADITFMAASLIDNNYALRLDTPELATRVRQRFTLTGVAFNRAMGPFILRGELAVKSPKAFNDAALQIVRRDEVDTYLALEYAARPSLSISVQGTHQYIDGWTPEIASAPQDRRSYLLSLTKLFLHDNLTIDVMSFFNGPYDSRVTLVLGSFKWNDHLTIGFNAVYPDTDDARSPAFDVRDQKQIGFKVQYQF